MFGQVKPITIKMRSSSISKTLFAFAFSVLINQSHAQVQEFKLDDPDIVFKDRNGNILSLDSVKSLVKKCPCSKEQSLLEDGRIALVITPMADTELKAADDESTYWISKWRNTKFPEFNLKNLKGESVSNSDLKDRFAVVNFWFISCKPCVAEIPELNKLVKKYKDQPILFLAPGRDDSEALLHFSEKTTFNYTILAESTEFMKEMGVYAYPTHLIIDRKGIIREVIVGGPDIYTRLDSMIHKMIGQEN
jgi:peroxiredoxin/Zn finger protein HypA/HybF involved in hydrogenase expression